MNNSSLTPKFDPEVGYFLSKKLLEQGCRVIGMDNINDYYDVNLKYSRLDLLKPFEKFTFIQGAISDKDMIMNVFREYRPSAVGFKLKTPIQEGLQKFADWYVEYYRVK
ncbi:hypothetical protein [Petroclostridium sp. X23]|uniref:hypothetical protein n=1 Tax=Petroclostridium sp. X23 TaxID=3045146 RepID=UPI0024ACCCFE|nr:hypothetical protein [Petroclostridium sp. X23]WHH57505.1 hypothetical protein QKW49_16935 [Petroclostridium sp. X23]